MSWKYHFIRNFKTNISNATDIWRIRISILQFMIGDNKKCKIYKIQKNNPFHFICTYGYDELINDELLHTGIDQHINDKNANKHTPLIYAVYRGTKNKKCIEKLCQMPSIDPNARGLRSESALIIAAERGLKDFIEILCSHPKTDVNAKEDDGYTALMMAAGRGDKQHIRELCKNPNIDINAKDRRGNSALMYAFYNHFEECVELLRSMLETDVRRDENIGLMNS